MFPFPERITMGPITTYGHSNQLLLPFYLKLDKNLKAFSLDYEVLVCKEICIPGTGKFEINVQNTSADFQDVLRDALAKLPVPSKEINFSYSQLKDQKLDISFKNFDLLEGPFFIKDVFLDSNLRKSHEKPTIIQLDKNIFQVMYKNEIQKEFSGVAVIGNSTGKEAAIVFAAKPEPSKILYMFLFALLGGLILNLMPCVLPILSLKFFSLTQLTPKNRISLLSGYILGVLVSFQVIAILLLSLKSGGESLGWGFQLQVPWFLIGMASLFSILALNLFGVWDFDIPFFSEKKQNSGFAKEFMTGLLAVVVASPCTAPFMGVALGFALTQSALATLFIFLGLGLGLALPFIVLLLFKNFKLPLKQGPWMNTLKVFLGFPLLATAVWLVYIYGSISGFTASFWLLGCLIFASLLIWTIQKLTPNKPTLRFVSIILIGLSLIAVDRFVFVNPPEQNQDVAKQTSDPINWIKFSESGFETLKKQQKPVFVDFTAEWCLSCKVNEKVTFRSEDVISAIKTKELVMMKADWTKKDPQIARVLKSYGRIGVPLYLLFYPKTNTVKILPEILTPEIFLNSIESI